MSDNVTRVHYVENEAAKRPVRLPNELYSEIIDHLYPGDGLSEAEYKRVLHRLCLVCRLFYYISVPRLFEALRCVGSKPLKGHTVIPHSKWFGVLMENKERGLFLSPFVKSLAFSQWIEAPIPCFEELPQFTGLRTLTLTNTPVNALFFQAALKLSSLQSLTMKHCTFQVPDPKIELPESSVALEEFSLTGAAADMASPYVPAMSLLLQAKALRSFETDLSELAETVFASQESFQVERLSAPLRAESATAFAQFLDRTESVTDLAIPIVQFSWDRDPPPVLDIKAESLPHLDSLRCPLFLLPHLLPDRPVRHIDISGVVQDDGDTCDSDDAMLCAPEIAFEILKRSSASVESLRVSTSILHVSPLHDYFKNLKTLAVYSEYQSLRCGIEHTCQMFPQFMRVQQFIFETKDRGVSEYDWDLGLQREQVQHTLSRAFPHATRIRITQDDFVEWRRDSHESPTWKPTILSRDPVKAYLKEKASDWEFWRDMINDDHGCLAALFGPEEMTDEIQKLLDPAFQDRAREDW